MKKSEKIMMPAAIAKYLNIEADGFDIHEKFAVLFKSIDGDDYYLRTELTEEGVLTEDFADYIYEIISTDFTYEDIFTWFVEWNILDELS